MRGMRMAMVTAAVSLWALGFVIESTSGAQVRDRNTQITFQGGIQPAPWFRGQELRQHLKFSDDQFTRLNKAYQDSWTHYNAGVSEIDKNLTPAQRRERLRALDERFYADFSSATGTIITDSEQRQRYSQIYLQYRGYGAFENPAVVEKLKLTSEQRSKFADYNQEWLRAMNDLAPTFRTDRDEGGRRFTRMQSDFSTHVNSVLTPEQQRTWRQMTGDPYTFTPDAYIQVNATDRKRP